VYDGLEKDAKSSAIIRLQKYEREVAPIKAHLLDEDILLRNATIMVVTSPQVI